MKKKLLDQLVKASYTKGELDVTHVNKIASLLRRADLKQYIRALKSNDKRRTVIIASAFPLAKKDEAAMKDVYPNKKLSLTVDPSLLLGVRITDNDSIYELNLRDTLHRMSTYIEE